ncbi:tannase and feruloyl esterase [Corynespora cassiicola Philippines]|uniref:Carboxylic ester hydrolase n=1 Tax=Corynespora cassiicola Philippines TaxID=1448308 RepID=A0A2T2P749_CORCC|nr:tannase and feruloyl esterase [Corynespora cassiicola Philippines]
MALLLPLVALLPALASAQSANFTTDCSSLADKLSIPGGTVSFSEFVAAGTTLQFPESDPSCTRASQAVSADVCRVGLNITTSPISSIRMEAWLPSNWTGRFLSTGNGGLGGCIQYEDIDYATSLGFAAVGTNNGHDGMSGETFNNLETVADFAFRAVHTGVVTGKQISQTFYGRNHTKSYYLGCSTGGRQGFKSVQSFPEDFDGVVAGAPAFAFNNLTSWSAGFFPLITGPEGSPTFVPLDMYPVIHQDILAQCDMIDGAADGILESPDLCEYDPSGLACAPGQNSSCLTPPQLETIRKSYAPIFDDQGSFVYPRLQPGAEATEAPFTLFTGQVFGSSDWFKFAIFNDSNWNPADLTPADFRLSSGKNLFNIETFEGDLSAFQNKGGKVLHYHGLIDGVITSENSPRYYEHVSQTMGLAPEALDDFYRFFRVSGLAHCSGGPGAGFIGNQARNSASLEPEENVLMAMVRWIEEGVAPESIIGSAVINGTIESGVDYKRRHCKYPTRNVFKGPGDVKDIDSWECVLD